MIEATVALAARADHRLRPLDLAAQRGRKPVNWKDLPAPFATPSARNNPPSCPSPKAPS